MTDEAAFNPQSARRISKSLTPTEQTHGITRSVVSKHVTAAYRQHGVHSRDELMQKLRQSAGEHIASAAIARA